MPDDFSTYVAGRGDALLRYGYLLTGDRHLAEDIVQDVLARVHRRWKRVSQLDQPDFYLRKAILRQYLSWRRRRSSTERAVPDVDSAGTVDDPVREHGERDAMWTLLATLPRQQRAVLVLRFYEDLDDARIADLLDCAPATVRSHRARGLEKLRQQLASQHVSMGEPR